MLVFEVRYRHVISQLDFSHVLQVCMFCKHVQRRVVRVCKKYTRILYYIVLLYIRLERATTSCVPLFLSPILFIWKILQKNANSSSSAKRRQNQIISESRGKKKRLVNLHS